MRFVTPQILIDHRSHRDGANLVADQIGGLGHIEFFTSENVRVTDVY